MLHEQFSTSQVIETERLRLRPLVSSDAGLIALYAADRRLAEMTPNIPHPLPEGWVEALIARASDPRKRDHIWAIEGKGDVARPELVGLISLAAMDRGQAEITYWVAPAMWNTGIASGAVRALIAANPLGCDTVFASVFQDNPGSARVLVNAGFEYLGDAEGFSVARGANLPIWTYLKKLA